MFSIKMDEATFRRKMQEISREIGERSKDVISKVSEEALDNIKENTPVDTGNLVNGWQMEVTGSSVLIYNNVPYATHVEYGTPYTSPVNMMYSGVTNAVEGF